MLVDSHCHLDLISLQPNAPDLQQILDNAKANQVTHFLCVCVELSCFPAMMRMIKPYPEVYASIGLHPTETPGVPVMEQELLKGGESKKVVAIGETGLDYYHIHGDVAWQQERFRTHIRAAIALQKPLIIHTRHAPEDTIRIMREEKAYLVGGVMHCFTESWEVAVEAMDLGFYISFSGIVTFKNARELQEVAKKVPLDKLLIETDAPFLAPVPYRGKLNQPAYVKFVAEFLATLRETSFQDIAYYSTSNFFKLFINQ